MSEVLTIFLYGLVESLALAMVVLSLLGESWAMRRLCPIAVLQCTGVYAIRSLPLVVGANTVLATMLLALLVVWLYKVSLGRAVVAACMSVALLVILELVFMWVAQCFIDIAAHPGLWFLSGVPHTLALFAVALVLRRRGKAVSF